MNIRRYTEEEITRLRAIMTRYTVDVEGCKQAAKELNRPYKGVYAKWSSIKPNKHSKINKEELAKILYKNISKYPGNIAEAIRVTSKETGRAFSTIQKLYYYKKSPYHHSKTEACFTLISRNKMSSNSKNFNSAQRTTKQKIKQFIAQILGIKKEDL